MVTLSRETTVIFISASFSNGDQHLKERICSHRSKFFALRVDLLFGTASYSMEANRKSQMLVPFVKLAEAIKKYKILAAYMQSKQVHIEILSK